MRNGDENLEELYSFELWMLRNLRDVKRETVGSISARQSVMGSSGILHLRSLEREFDGDIGLGSTILGRSVPGHIGLALPINAIEHRGLEF